MNKTVDVQLGEELDAICSRLVHEVSVLAGLVKRSVGKPPPLNGNSFVLAVDQMAFRKEGVEATLVKPVDGLGGITLWTKREAQRLQPAIQEYLRNASVVNAHAVVEVLSDVEFATRLLECKRLSLSHLRRLAS